MESGEQLWGWEAGHGGPYGRLGLFVGLRWKPLGVLRRGVTYFKGYVNKLCIEYQRRQWQPTPVLLPGKSHGRRSLVGGSPWGSQRGLSDFTFTFHFHALEKEMATHSSVLAWRFPGTGEPGGLPSMGSHRVGHD